MNHVHHALHPDHGTLCRERLGGEPVRLNADAVTCPDCLPLIPKPGEIRDGLHNDAGVLRRDFTAVSRR